VPRPIRLKALVRLCSVAAIAASVGCGTRNVEVLSTTTTSPTSVGVSPSSEPIANVVVTGVVGSINTTSRSIVVSGTTVSVPSSATIRNRIASLLTFGDLRVGQTVTIQANRSGSTITALEIFIEDGPDTDVQLEGQVSGLTGTCPSLTFRISGTTVATIASTMIDGGCAKVVNGAAVLVNGVRQSDGSVTASDVVVQRVQAAGSITALGGSCPSITFSLGSTAVSTSSVTLFAGRACGQLSDGTAVRVDGYIQSDGSIAAASVSQMGSSR
jgi:hypothetical protein